MLEVKSVLVLVLAAVDAVSASRGIINRRSDDPTINRYFKDLKPSTDLAWTPCFQNFTCVRLQVPLDYKNLAAGNTSIAFIKRSAQNASAEDILINPGGPGASGIDTVLSDANFTNMFDNYFGGQFNMVGFDPRGVHSSDIDINLAACNSKTVNISDTIDKPENSPEYLPALYDRRKEFNERCTQLHQNTNAKYAGSVAVAGDMLYYTELRAKSLGQPADKSKLWFYGVSYGTILGATYASLYPDRVGRMVLDGVADSDEQFSGPDYSSLADIDKAVGSFFRYCAQAGPEKCVLAKGKAKGAIALQTQFDNLLAQARTDIKDKNKERKALRQYGPAFMKKIMFQALYNPVALFPMIAEGLYALTNGKVDRFTQLFIGVDEASDAQTDDTEDAAGGGDSSLAQINCLDSAGRANLSLEEFQVYAARMTNFSFYYGDALTGSFCSGFGVIPPQSQIFSGRIGANTTGVPILFISTTADPVTPLVSAFQMSSQFGGASTLVVNGTGHSSLSTPSQCVKNYAKAYFAQGTVPANATMCQSDVLPFEKTLSSAQSVTNSAQRAGGSAVGAIVAIIALIHVLSATT